MAKVFRTTLPLPFHHLEPKRFEAMTHSIVDGLHSPITLHHIGAAGNEDGVDIEGFKPFADGKTKRWVIQCKRYIKLGPADAIAAVDEATQDGKPIDFLLLVTGCAVSKKTRAEAKAHSLSKGVPDFDIWDATNLETTLLNSLQELLSHYFGIDYRGKPATREAILKRRDVLAKKMRKDFLCTAKDWKERQYKQRAWEWNIRKVLIREEHDETYNDTSKLHETQYDRWFRAFPIDFYINGIRVTTMPEHGFINPTDDTWGFCGTNKAPKSADELPLYPILHIPYDSIVTYNTHFDEFGEGPTIRVRYARGDEPPYERLEWAFVFRDFEGFHSLPPARKIELPK